MGLSNVYGIPGFGKRPLASLIDGKSIAADLREEVAARTAEFAVGRGWTPVLATILIGDDPASAVYVGAKIKACDQAGLGSVHHHLPAHVSLAEVLDLIDELNADERVSGILCQLPVPVHLDGAELTNRVDPSKDVDGLTIASAGRLALGLPGLRPCTPSGVLRLLEAANVGMRGRRAVVIGRSNLFGKPMAQMLTQEDATVTLCHSATQDLPEICRDAEVLVAAAGCAEMVKGDWVRPGATVIDVGINRSDGGFVGDVDFGAVAEVAGAITPVPGGVGPMTIACLLSNTLEAAMAAR